MHITIDLNNYTKTDSFFNRSAARGIICRGDRYLMIYGKNGDYKFPGGGVETGESFEETLIREVCEETGYDVIPESVMEYGTALEKRAGETADVMIMDSHYFTCEITDIQGKQSLVDYEIDMNYKTVWITLPEAISNNEKVTDLETCPWVVRDTNVMKYIFSEKERKVNIFDRFSCRGGECELTCCMEWKIAVDEETWAVWRQNKEIPADCTKMIDGSRVIKLKDNHKCPFLLEDGLCSLVKKYGESYISDTCHIFPRQVNDFGDRKECSLVCCCPYVVDLLNDASSVYINRAGNTGLFAIRDKVTDYFSNREISLQQAMLAAFYYLTADDFDEQEIMDAVSGITNVPEDTYAECNELFLDIAVNYVKEGMYSDFLLPLYELGESLCDEGICNEDIAAFEKGFAGFDILMRKYFVSEVIANLLLPDYDIESMTIALQWIAMEYVCIRQVSFLLWKNKGTLLYNDIRLCITIISRMTGYDEPDIREYMENSFDNIIFEPAYLALIIGGTNETPTDN